MKPVYVNPRLSPYSSLDQLGEDEEHDPYHLAPSLMAQIRTTPYQEIGSHTFSHYFCLEPGQTMEAFRADLEAMRHVGDQEGILLRSFVFPRNQFQPSYLKACAEFGFQVYRGNELSWIYAPRNEERQSLIQRAIRLLDAYIPLSGHHTYPLMLSSSLPYNVPSSRFLRPYVPPLRWFEGWRIQRILGDMTYAARRGEIYHLWWHPHNFGAHQEENFGVLDTILRHYKKLEQTYGMESLHMAEVGERMKGV